MAIWYMFMKLMTDDEENQKKGVVSLLYNVGSKRVMNRVHAWQGGITMSVLPVRFVSLHFCYNNAATKPIVSLAMAVYGAHARTRIRAHYGAYLSGSIVVAVVMLQNL